MTSASLPGRSVRFSERVWPLALLFLTLWVYRPYAGVRLVSGNDDSDGLTYHAVVADALAQLHVGTFPAYVGQSAYRWNGGTYPQAQAPGLSLLAVALDLATLGRLGSAGVLNAVVLLCALGGALAMYVGLRPLDAGRPWLSAAAAFLYVACPGVLGVLMRLDMYTTLLALPLLPILWRALLGLLEGGSTRQALALGLATAALWTCHAPVALWATSAAVVVALVYAPLPRWPWRALCVAVALFLAAEAWHLTTLFSLAAQPARHVGLGDRPFASLPDSWVEAIQANLRADVPGALLPVGWALGGRVNGWPVEADEARFLPAPWRERAGTPYLQLGYPLWGALLFGLAVALRSRDRRALAPAGGALLLLAFLFPWPWLGELLWSRLPSLYSITRLWPMQRFYVLLASLAPFAALAAVARLRPRLLAGLVSVAALWGLHEADKLSKLALRARRAPGATLVENSPLKRKDLQMGARRHLPEFSDPALHLRLVPAGGQPALVANLMAVRERAPAGAWPLAMPQAGQGGLATLTLEPGRRQLVFFRGPPGVRLAASGPDYWRQASANQLPLWTSLSAPQRVTLLAVAPADMAPASLELALVPYQPERLPLALVGLLPLRVRIPEAPAGTALETPRLYLPGYRASVDGQAAPVRPSVDGYALVDLPAGAREVQLEYLGTPAMRAAFWLSALAWCAGLVALASGLSFTPRGATSRGA